MMIGVVIGTIAIVLVTVVIGLLVDRRAPVLPLPDPPRKQLPHGAGEAPATALRLREAQLANLRGARRCARCRTTMRHDPDEAVRSDAAELTVLHFTCERCGSQSTLYVATR